VFCGVKGETMDVITAFLLTFPIVFVISLLFDGIDRKIHARMQRRIGPPIIQPFYDFIKLLNKERIVPAMASSQIFTVLPTLAAASSILSSAILFTSVMSGTSFGGDLVVVFYLLAMSSVLVTIGGSSSGNPYGAIGFSRKMTMLIAYEVPLLLSFLSVFLKINSTSYYNAILTQVKVGSMLALAFPSMAVSAVAFLLCIPAAADAVPFDVSEAKTEIIYGPLVEYSGPYLALFKLAKASSNLSLTFLACTLFFYLPALFGDGDSLWLGAFIVCLLLALILWFLTITVPRTVFARMKVGQAFKFYWIVALPLSVIAVVLSALGL